MKLSEQILVPQQRDSTKAKLERDTAARTPRTARTRHSSPQPSQPARSEDEGMVIRCCLQEASRHLAPGGLNSRCDAHRWAQHETTSPHTTASLAALALQLWNGSGVHM